MTLDEARGIAARIWCLPQEMDVYFAESIALELVAASGWEETAMQYARNAEYYRSLVIRIGECFGQEAKISDDGSVQNGILCAKVPELVEAMFVKPSLVVDGN